ncbi:VIT family protein [Sporolactobacillus sp. CQH2019]|uniref:VIT1/CCC1 transporter family protein n=1 Tax=Sporolactobacillus sp. CQH2019 TaxID=3023512 RepID=UPI002367F061|nr:VIT family protein [Sporolactobacillus sp. CQH2019]MDD9150589.1 VIT family protein [Sporolactobacillus sp. CQH2019]
MTVISANEPYESTVEPKKNWLQKIKNIFQINKITKKFSLAQKINVLRASVMGANDGIISVAGIVLGVAGATSNHFAIFISGIGGLLAGNISMAMGEYVSVHSQKDAQQKATIEETQLLKTDYDQQYQFISNKLMASGISSELSEKAAQEMMAKDPLVTVVREKYGFDPNEFTSPFAAALASMLSFTSGALLPLAAITLFPAQWRIAGTVLTVVFALILTGYSAAALGNANKMRGIIRNTFAGLLTMLATYFIGSLFA